MILDGVRIRRVGGESPDLDVWPFSVPAVRQLVREGIAFRSPVTFLVGENGSGKSTLVEALAEAYGVHVTGGDARRRYARDIERSELSRWLRLDRGDTGRRRGYFLRAETAYDLLQFASGQVGYGGTDFTTMSHGESYLALFGVKFSEPGLYLLDEPETPLSFSSTLQLVVLLQRLQIFRGQVICATHSPLLTALPGADILEIGSHGIRRTTWDRLDIVDHWRRYLEDPGRYLRHLLEEPGPQ